MIVINMLTTFNYLFSFRAMSGFAAIVAKWGRQPPKSTFVSVWKRMSASSAVASSAVASPAVASPAVASPAIASPPIASSSHPRESSSSKPKRFVQQKKSKSSPVFTKKEDNDIIKSYMAEAVRDSSKRSYLSYWKRFESFCELRKIPLCAAESISLFLISLAESSNNKSSALLAKTSIKYHLKLLNPKKKASTDSYMVNRVAKAISKKYSKPVKKAKTISSSIIKEIVMLLLGKGLKEERTAVFLLMQFLLIGRYEEISKIKPENVLFRDDGHIEVTLLQAKNYDVWDGQKSLIAKGEGSFDPVRIIKDYASKIEGAPWLFPNFKVGKNKTMAWVDKPVSYNNMLKLFREALDEIGLDGKSFSLHSVRTGALSEAANSEDVDKDDLRRHGRWKSLNMVDYYHELSLEKRLAAVKSLSIYNF